MPVFINLVSIKIYDLKHYHQKKYEQEENCAKTAFNRGDR